MLPKLENKTPTGTKVYIVLSIINCSTYVYNILYSVQQNKAYASWILGANRARAGPPFGMVQNTYRTRTVEYQRIYVCILFLKNAHSKLDSYIVANLWVIESNYKSQWIEICTK